MFGFITQIYTKYLIYRSKKFLKKYSNSKIYKNNKINDPISILCEKYGSDKGGLNNFSDKRKSHFYASYYHDLFKSKKEKINLVLECGIGTNDEKIPANMTKYGKPGASLRVFREYFKNAKIYGADIDKNILFNDNRIQSYYVDQLSTKSINKMWNEINKDNFDIIIDDGMHNFNASLNFFKISFIKLKKGGFYIIEDVNVSYLLELAKKLEKFNPMIVFTSNKNNIDDYLFIIKKL